MSGRTVQLFQHDNPRCDGRCTSLAACRMLARADARRTPYLGARQLFRDSLADLSADQRAEWLGLRFWCPEESEAA